MSFGAYSKQASRQVPGTLTLTAIPLNFDNGVDANAFKSNIMTSAERAFTLSIDGSDINMAPFWVKPGEKLRSIYRYTPFVQNETEGGANTTMIFSPEESKDKGCLDHQHNTTGFPEDVLLASDWNSSACDPDSDATWAYGYRVPRVRITQMNTCVCGNFDTSTDTCVGTGTNGAIVGTLDCVEPRRLQQVGVAGVQVVAFTWHTVDMNADKENELSRINENWSLASIQEAKMSGTANPYSVSKHRLTILLSLFLRLYCPQCLALLFFSVPSGDCLIDVVLWQGLGGQKVATLSGDVSQISDKRGFAHFPNLAVQGSTSENIFLHFWAAGVVMSWVKPSPTDSVFPGPLGQMRPKLLRMPIRLETNVSKVEIVSTLVESVTEGRDSTWNSTLKVTNAQGQPIAGKLVYLVVTEAPGVKYPLRYQPQLAVQHSTMTQPVNKMLLTTSSNTFTDENGHVDLQAGFDTKGRAGEYKV